MTACLANTEVSINSIFQASLTLLRWLVGDFVTDIQIGGHAIMICEIAQHMKIGLLNTSFAAKQWLK